ncbi:hypothetical protein FRC07_005509 [Ceratobasidium sp. 392]|nr:hypothetical protein FRC07_005509 [Ceratobasidium sp. 392]
MSRPQHQASPAQFTPTERSTTADSDEENATTSTGLRPLSRNAQAQARLRARRKAYVESLEANVKRLQAIVDALSVTSHRHLYPPLNDSSSLTAQLLSSSGSAPPTSFSLSPSINLTSPSQGSDGTPAQQAEGQMLHRLQVENGRLRRERDALRVQLNALVAYVSSGAASSARPSLGSNVSGGPGYMESAMQQSSNAASQPFTQGSSYNDAELSQLRSPSALDLAALQAYLSLPISSSQYPTFSSTPASSSVDTLGTEVNIQLKEESAQIVPFTGALP